jgi:hypothetical protein
MHPRPPCQIGTIGSFRAVGYLLRGTTDGVRGDIVQEIISIVRQVASGLPPEQPNSLDV